LFRERLNREVRQAMPVGPRFLRWMMLRPSGPTADELPLSRMAAVEMGDQLVLSGWRERIRGLSRRESLFRRRDGAAVNCLQKAFAISLWWVRVWASKVTDWLGGRGLLPKRKRRRDQK